MSFFFQTRRPLSLHLFCFFISCCCLVQSSIVLSPGDDVTHLFEGGKRGDFLGEGLFDCLFVSSIALFETLSRHSFQMRRQEKLNHSLLSLFIPWLPGRKKNIDENKIWDESQRNFLLWVSEFLFKILD